jgi:CTP:molybdopterin cytidylyltransferase MocA
MSVLAVVLAAGASSRMRAPKALLRLQDGRTLLRAHLDALWGVEVRVVQGRWALPVPAVHNPDWATTGMVESLSLAIRGTQHPRILVTPVDAAPVDPTDLARLLAAPGAASLCWQGQQGHPIVVPREAIRPPRPLNQLEFTLVEATSARVLVDLDTPERWQAFSSSPG